MHLPSRLQDAIERQLTNHGLGQLSVAAAELSRRYRNRRQENDKPISTPEERLAYLAVRMPATYAAVRGVFAEIRRLMPELLVNSLLDLGSGPGTAAWAAMDVFDEIQKITLIEQDVDLIKLGQMLSQESEHPPLRQASWQQLNLKIPTSFPVHDLIVYSYSLGEVEPEAMIKVLSTAWHATQRVMAIVEPGTMKGFELIRTAREELIKAGGYVIAPCPHHHDCPMADDDWCHYAARFERSSLHRRIKSASLGYEDEKFSYIAVAKDPVQPAEARVIRHPSRYTGHTQLQLCAKDQLQTITVSRRDKELWKRARKVDWGDAWD